MTTPRLISDRYEIGPALGYGGMSEVHGGRDVRLGRDVAVKVLRADLARDPQFQIRFRREAQNAAGLNHPAIVAVYDTGEFATGEAPLPYIVMEYVPGRTLRDIVKTEGPMDPYRVCEVLADVCAALDYSHNNGIVHRDVKPANVMITPGGAVKVMDFGIARAVSDAQPAVTQTAAVIGTAQYLSPEQARGETVDARSDVYATGCVLFELLTGRPPFTGDSPVAVAYQHVREDPQTPSDLNAAVPPELDAIAMQALAKNPSNRYQSAEAMREDLYRVLQGARPSAPLVMTAAERTEMLTGPQNAVREPEPEPDQGDDFAAWQAQQEEARRRARRKRLAVVGVIAALIGVFAAAYFLFSPSARTVAVPGVTGQTQDVALRTLTQAGLRPNIQQVPSRSEEVGRVVASNPAGGMEVAADTVVDLRVGRGPDRVDAPDLSGQSPEQAQASVQRLGLTLTPVPQQRQVDDPSQIGKVISQSPSAGTTVSPGTAIQLTVGQRRETLSLPDVVGQNRGTAESNLEGVGLQVTVREVDGAQPPGTVLETSPAAGTTVTRGSPVTVEVSRGNQQQVPSLLGRTTQEAVRLLSQAGFTGTVSESTRTVSDPSQDGKIVSQTPGAGSRAGRGDTISIVVGRATVTQQPGAGVPDGPTNGNGNGPAGLFPGN